MRGGWGGREGYAAREADSVGERSPVGKNTIVAFPGRTMYLQRWMIKKQVGGGDKTRERNVRILYSVAGGNRITVREK